MANEMNATEINEYVAKVAEEEGISEPEAKRKLLVMGISRRRALRNYAGPKKGAPKGAKKAAAKKDKPVAKKASKKVMKKGAKKAPVKAVKPEAVVSEGEED
jgi:hypothetical protein